MHRVTEYLDAITSPRTPRPDVLVYRRTEEPLFGGRDRKKIAEALEQLDRVDAFFARFRDADGSLAAGVNEYATPDAFRWLLRQHLDELLHRRLPAGASGGSEPRTTAATIPDAYLDWLREQCADVSLLGQETQQGQALTLSHVYVPALTAAPAEPALPKSGKRRREKHLDETERKPIPLLQRLDADSLYGPAPAGAGKSTFCRWAVLQSIAAADLTHPLPAPDEFAGNAKHRQQWTSTLAAYAFPVIGDLPVAAVDTPLVLRILEPIWTTRTETASRLRGRIEAVLDWATVRGFRAGDNPARWRGHLGKLLPPRSRVAPVEHHAAMRWDDVPAFIADLRCREGIAARALEFTILTAARTGEVTGARWAEIEGGVWTIPAARMKVGREHRVPLSPPARAIVDAMRETAAGDHLFPGGQPNKPLSNMAMAAVLRRMGRDDVTPHGFRSSFRDWAGETTAFPREVIEHALAHQLRDKAEAAYARGDLFTKRAHLMRDWAAHCSTCPLDASPRMAEPARL